MVEGRDGPPCQESWTLDVLSIAGAITLFRRVAGHGGAHEEDHVAVAVGLCGRLPLAIQVTAGRAGARLLL